MSRDVLVAASGRHGFTLIELLLAVAVLIAVILATSRIFSTASDVTGIGQATANVLQEAAVIEKRMREDIKNLSPEGIFLIRQVAVPNNVHGDDLLDPNLPPDYIFRSDQLLFFADGVEQMQTSGFSEGALSRVQSSTSRVYYGHGFQLPDGLLFRRQLGATIGWAHDPNQNVFPWHRGEVSMTDTRIAGTGASGGPSGTIIFRPEGPAEAPVIDGTQPVPRQWLMVRQPVLLANDSWYPPNSNGRTVVFNFGRTARSIFNDQLFGSATPHPIFGWSREVRNSRMDGAASSLAEIRRYITNFNTGNPNNPKWWTGPRPWIGQREVLSTEVLYYPRAERYPPSMQRQDQALTNIVLGSAVSSIVIEWTWDDGTGAQLAPDGSVIPNPSVFPAEPDPDIPWHWYLGFLTNCYDTQGNQCYGGEDRPDQPWFGLNLDWRTWEYLEDFAVTGGGRGVGFMALEDPFQPANAVGRYQNIANYHYPISVAPWPPPSTENSLERYFTIPDPDHVNDVHVYEAFFAYNQQESLIVDPSGSPGLWPSYQIANTSVDPSLDLGYTPWPSAIRVTLIMHDPQGRLEHGREFQFVIDLPRRTRQKTVVHQ